MNILLDKDTKRNLRIKDIAEALESLRLAIEHATNAVGRMKREKFEDAYSEADDAEAYCAEALVHIRELLP